MGGPIFKVRALARNLVGLGHHVTVLTADLGLKSNNLIPAHYKTCEWGFRNDDDGFETIYLSTAARYRALTLNPALVRYAETAVHEFDIVHFYGVYDLFGPVMSAVCRKRQVPYRCV